MSAPRRSCARTPPCAALRRVAGRPMRGPHHAQTAAPPAWRMAQWLVQRFVQRFVQRWVRPPNGYAARRAAGRWPTSIAGLLLAAAVSGTLAQPQTPQTPPVPASALTSAAVASGPDAADAAGQVTSGWVEGVVRRVDTAQGKLTLRHGPIAQWDMPPMTMVFRLAEPGVLARLKVGDAVRFAVERRQGQYVVTAIEPLQR